MTENSRNVFTMDRALLTIVVLAVIAIAGTFLFVPYFPQDPAYHHFADTRVMAGIPNAWNVLSNLPFLIIGVLSLMTVRRDAASIAFGLGLVLTAFGSAYYHWSPNDDTLLWDRAGMVVALMAVVALLVDSTRVLAIAEVIGVGSLIWWQVNGDLRLYGVVQFFPGLLILVLRRWRLLPVLVFYAIAKVCEQYDAQIYDALGHAISGHALKHFAAAASTFVIWMWMRRRQLIALESSPPGSGVRSSPIRETTT
jgi:hypothetical protein